MVLSKRSQFKMKADFVTTSNTILFRFDSKNRDLYVESASQALVWQLTTTALKTFANICFILTLTCNSFRPEKRIQCNKLHCRWS